MLLAAALCAGPQELKSPDGRIRIEIDPEMLAQPSGRSLGYRVHFKDALLLSDSRLGVTLRGQAPFGTGLAVEKASTQTIDETWTAISGKRRVEHAKANELTLVLRETSPAKRAITYTFRAYDDGIAFRYEIPSQPGLEQFAIISEESEFALPHNCTVFAADFGGFHTHQESEYPKTAISQLKFSHPYGSPLLIEHSSGRWAALSEAATKDWAVSAFGRVSTGDYTLQTLLTPRWDDPSVAVLSQTMRASPWRVVLIGDSPLRLIESSLVQNLNEPCALADTSWIKPGIAAWDRWWSGDYAPDTAIKPGMSMEAMKYYIDFAAEMGWPYQLVDWTWYGEPFHPVKGDRGANPTADITRAIPGMDIPALVAYAQQKGVRLLLWIEWSQANRQMDEAFALYEKWGIAGVKIDFTAREDQEMVNFYHRTAAKAAAHHLMLDIHGAYRPDGLSRTYPNFMTREGVLGNEYNKWSARTTPTHCVTLPFTRGLLGEMDFTPGGWRQKSVEEFRHSDWSKPGTFVMGTRCFQLAMFVVYDSGFTVACDSPYSYRSSPAGLDFLKQVPTRWDDTQALAGEPGSHVAIARRNGDVWYVGAMSEGARTLQLPLSFLGAGEWNAELWTDGPDAAEYPDRLVRSSRVLKANATLSLELVKAGGAVVVLKRK